MNIAIKCLKSENCASKNCLKKEYNNTNIGKIRQLLAEKAKERQKYSFKYLQILSDIYCKNLKTTINSKKDIE